MAEHTSRDGDPQLHIHNLVLNRVRREADGQYRTLDSRTLHGLTLEELVRNLSRDPGRAK